MCTRRWGPAIVIAAQLPPAAETTIKLAGGKNTDRRLEAIKEKGRKAKLKLTIYATDAAGQSDVVGPFKITLR
jgi:hypothetical protein